MPGGERRTDGADEIAAPDRPSATIVVRTAAPVALVPHGQETAPGVRFATRTIEDLRS